tara:strand:- start:29266 stop:29628 length:363 start_codon:yes stop_codon:yes gene_type:complete
MVVESKINEKVLPQAEKGVGSTFITVMVTTFTTVFLAELGDKTQLATLLLSAQSGKPVVVFIGAAIALISSSLVGVVLGRWLSNRMKPERFRYMAGILMIGLSCWLGSQGLFDISGTGRL